MNKESDKKSTNRRTFLRTSLMLSAIGLSATAYGVNLPNENFGADNERKLRLANENTREKLDVIYWRDGKYIADHIGQLNYFMRDHHVNKAIRMDKRLYDYLYVLYGALETDERLHILSGYRTAATNLQLKKRWPSVAKNSFHIKGRAADIYIPGMSSNKIQQVARQLNLGGVGYYKNSGFVHLDTGYVRHWVTT